ncbi:hypothetical protein F5Y13DRAFT_162624 [Hypoxylon sp. FL1857]|nr:hypothetical protein F5Y13DRAFT_162624 [Hypoxylon sp. FL1857]
MGLPLRDYVTWLLPIPIDSESIIFYELSNCNRVLQVLPHPNPVSDLPCDMSRHMACKVCRDRKVRCDGNQPACDKCIRSGDECVYAPPSLPSRQELAQTIESLQERLVKAEAQILEQSRNSQCTGLPSPYSTSLLSQTPTLDLQMPFPPAPPRTTLFLPNGDFRSLGQAYGDPEDATDFFGSLQNCRPPTRAATQVPEELPLVSPVSTTLPSLNELRAMNSQHSSIDLGTGCDLTFGGEAGDTSSITTSLLDLMSSFFSIQADITGLSSAVAEYLAWVRKSPSKADNATVLEILEARVRELNQIASTRHWAAFKHMHASIGTGDSFHVMLRKLETDLMDRSIKTMHFFHDRYDITTTLAEQRHD